MTVRFPKLRVWQKDLLDYYKQHTSDKWIVVKSCRQASGKSFFAQILLIYTALSKSCVSLSVSPVLSQSRKMFQDVCKMASDLITSSNASTYEITFINGSKILFRSGEQGNTIRGNTVSGICVIDEAAFIRDDDFYQIIVPTTSVYKSNIFLFSTPLRKQGCFYNLFMQGLAGEGKVVSFDWTTYDLSKYLTPETLELYRQQMPKLAFQSEILGEFIDGSGTVFTDFKDCISDYELKDSPIFIGIDWCANTGNDNTAITVSQVVEGKVRIHKIIAFNDKNTTETIDYIVDLVTKLKAYNHKITVTSEKNSIGNVYFSILYQRLHSIANCFQFTTTNKSKEKIIKQLMFCFEQEKISIPNDKDLIIELSAYECKISATGLPVYNAPVGVHDDRIMSLAICVDSLYRYL